MKRSACCWICDAWAVSLLHALALFRACSLQGVRIFLSAFGAGCGCQLSFFSPSLQDSGSNILRILAMLHICKHRSASYRLEITSHTLCMSPRVNHAFCIQRGTVLQRVGVTPTTSNVMDRDTFCTFSWKRALLKRCSSLELPAIHPDGDVTPGW